MNCAFLSCMCSYLPCALMHSALPATFQMFIQNYLCYLRVSAIHALNPTDFRIQVCYVLNYSIFQIYYFSLFLLLYLSYLYSMIKSHHGVSESPWNKRKKGKKEKRKGLLWLALPVTVLCSKPNLFSPKLDPFPMRFSSIHCIACNHKLAFQF